MLKLAAIVLQSKSRKHLNIFVPGSYSKFIELDNIIFFSNVKIIENNC